LILRIPESWARIQSQNVRDRRHWSAAAKEKKRWMHALRAALIGRLPRNPPAFVQASITRIYGGRAREMDLANMIGGCKGLVDCLVQLRLIQDDKPSCFNCEYIQCCAQDDWRGTVIELTEGKQ
jgi:hypothetical protein